VIEFRGTAKTWSDGTVGLEPLDLTVPAASTTVLVGSSGSGKTTLLRTVNRMVDPTAGAVLVDGRDVATVDPVALRRSIGYVLQSGGLLPHRSVLDNVARVPALRGRSRNEARERARATLDLVGLDGALVDRYPDGLSGGQQQRVGVARALVGTPRVLLMDEPFGAVDPVVRSELQDELRRIRAELGTTILFVTHDMDEALLLGDEIVVMRPGGVVAQRGTPEVLLSAPADDFVARFIGSGNAGRALALRERDGVEYVEDRGGRIVGRLTASA
jgi:osmoprotectant transport system ATP-binding protein